MGIGYDTILNRERGIKIEIGRIDLGSWTSLDLLLPLLGPRGYSVLSYVTTWGLSGLSGLPVATLGEHALQFSYALDSR